MKIGKVTFPQVGPQTRALTAPQLAARGIDGPIFVFLEDYRVEVEIDGVVREIFAPKGSETDWASIPPAARPFLNDDHRWILEPSVAHDRVYELMGRMFPGLELSRADADEILRVGMLVSGCPAWLARLVFLGVRAGGGSHWQPSKTHDS